MEKKDSLNINNDPSIIGTFADDGNYSEIPQPETPKTKKCRYCCSEIPIEAIICKVCLQPQK